MFERLRKLVVDAAKSSDFQLSEPEFSNLGHFTTNAAFIVAKRDKISPIEAAERLKASIIESAPKGFIDRIDVVKPGFLNFWLTGKAMQESFAKIAADKKYGTGAVMKGEKIIVEYTDPNPFKEFHIGHLMSNAIGESISRLIEAQGANIKRLSYGGDVGLHVAKAMFGVLLKKDKISDVRKADEKEQLKFWADAYVSGSAEYEVNENSKKEIDGLNKIIFEKTNEEINALYDWGRTVSIKHFQETFTRLGTKFSKNYWESEVFAEGMKAVTKGLAENIFEKSEGAIVFKGEQYGLHTRVFVNSRGIPTYEAKELGLAIKKYKEFKFDKSIVITANEQNDYFKVLLKVMDLLMPKVAGKTIHISHGIMRLASGKMSSRKGNVITADSLLDQIKAKLGERINKEDGLSVEEREAVTESIAVGALKYCVLRQGPGQDIVFDFDKSLSFEGDSGPYLQYAYVRALNILGKAGKVRKADYKFLNSEEEFALIRKLVVFPEVVANCAKSLASSGLAGYLYDLSKLMNRFYEAKHVLNSEPGIREARIALVNAVASVLKTGLNLLGIQTVDKM